MKNNLNERIKIILENIENKKYTSFEFNNKKRKYDELNEDLGISTKIIYKDSKFYIFDKKLQKISLDDCPICYEKIKIADKITLRCNHIFCQFCHYNWEKSCFLGNKEFSCPLCRKISNTS